MEGMDRTETRGGPPRALAQTVARITRPAFARRGFAKGDVVRRWPLIVGTYLAARSKPERIVFPKGKRDDGTLVLRVGSVALAVELQHLEPLVIERVNGFFGYGAVARLRLIQGPVTAPAAMPDHLPAALDGLESARLEKRMAEVTDPDLRAALDALGHAVTIRNRGQGNA